MNIAAIACFVALLFLTRPAYADDDSCALQIVARYVTGSPARHTYMAMGEALVFVEGQDAKLEADQIFYDDRTQLLEARGHVRVTRKGQVTKNLKDSGERMHFKIDAPDCLLTESVAQVTGPKIYLLAPEDIAR